MYEQTYFIVYPGGDKTRLSVASLSQACYYEKSDYAVASRHEWTDEQEAKTYCKELAQKHSLIYESDDDDYLD